MDKRAALDRKIIIFISKDGTITSAFRGSIPFERAMPVYSVDRIDDVRRLQIYLCQEQSARHPLLSDQPWFVYEWSGDVADLDDVMAEFDAAYDMLNRKQSSQRSIHHEPQSAS